ncbi:MAG: cytochrome b [Enterovibrio sp.]
MQKFSKAQISLHWITLFLLIISYTSIELRGLFDKSSLSYMIMRGLHYNASVLVFVIMIIRLVLRRIYPEPKIIPEPPHWQHIIAKAMYFALYSLFLILPILGTLIMASGGKSWLLFGVFNIEPFIETDIDLRSVIKEWHILLANIGYGLIAIHALAALYHHYIIKDNALIIMMPNKKEK